MTFVLERDGIAACPDNPARTDTPEPGITPKMVALMIDVYFRDIEQSVWDVIRGTEDTAYIGGQSYDVDELWELITEGTEARALFRAICSRPAFSGTANIGDGLIEAWCHRKAKELAEKELL